MPSPLWGKGKAVVGLCVMAVATGVIFAATSLAGGAASPFEAAQTMLASSRFNIQVSPLSDSTPVAVTEQQAEDTALQHANGEAASGSVTATLVSATDKARATVAADGTPTLVISNRTAWLVLVPNQQVPIHYPPDVTVTGPTTYAATLAVFIDANTGEFLEAAALNS